MKKIIVACGSGVATSQTVASKVEDLLKDRKIKGWSIDVGDFKSIASVIHNYDIYISLSPGNEVDHGVITFSGIPFLTGFGMEDELNKIIEEIEK